MPRSCIRCNQSIKRTGPNECGFCIEQTYGVDLTAEDLSHPVNSPCRNRLQVAVAQAGEISSNTASSAR